MKKKYCYAVVNVHTGRLLLDCGRLPIFYLLKVAKEVALNFKDHVVIKVQVSLLYEILNKSLIDTSKPTT